jgi:ABC-type multidrug transport system fused ATPase/permease subunit
MAGYRLMPALQQIYGAITQLRYSRRVVDILHDDMLKLQNIKEIEKDELIDFSNQIELKNLYYSYPDSNRTALNGINVNIIAKSKVGFVGATGSGKTTTIDIILGLLEAQNGTLEIDGVVITNANKRSWQRSIGYVPQHIYLTDDSVAKNIAFGLEDTEINQAQVEKVSKIANLHKFVIGELPNGYQTTLGERGVRLSGGQRQRIAIARALYHNPKVLILDEATSALDNLTESAVMEAIENISNNITVIMIAHRLSTVKNCDNIILLEEGRVTDQGSYEELMRSSNDFRIMTKN